MKCEHEPCENEATVKEPSQTLHPFEGVEGSDEDPNRPLNLCIECAEEYREMMKEMWAEYNSGRL